MIQIVVPMAGRGSRFANAGFTVPKPLIPVGGKPMIQWVIDNVRPAQPHTFTFICLQEHLERYPKVPETLRSLCPGCNIVTVSEVTEGAACTVLLAKEFIDNDDALMIANADQFVELDINTYLAEMELQNADGLIMTFDASHPKWSYCRMNENGMVSEVLEKQPVSNEATVGIYNFRRGSDYVLAAEQMIAADLRVNNEFYVAPTYNQLIGEGGKVVVCRTGREYDGMYGLGVPEDLEFFKATTAYDLGRIDAAPALQARDLIEILTRQYVSFFNTRNLSGIAALLCDDFAIEDPTVKRLEGRTEVLAYLKGIFDSNADLGFKANNIFIDGSMSIIEFELKIAGERYCGTDVVQWKSRKMLEMRAYLQKK
ncbi:NTP transferase domain-containing protein [bacterium]|nr:NTP transferase domain-containing protein [bacterium]